MSERQKITRQRVVAVVIVALMFALLLPYLGLMATPSEVATPWGTGRYRNERAPTEPIARSPERTARSDDAVLEDESREQDRAPSGQREASGLDEIEALLAR